MPRLTYDTYRYNKRAAFDDFACLPFEQVDWDRLHRERRGRMLEAMRKRGIEGLVALRDDVVHYISGSTTLHVFGRSTSNVSTYMNADGEVFVTAPSPEWVPYDIPADHLLPIPWNLETLRDGLQRALGPVIQRLGKIAVSRGDWTAHDIFYGMLKGATVVDADEIIHEAMQTKTRDELILMKTALAIAEAALHDVIRALRPGMRELECTGIFAKRAAELGSTSGDTEGSFCVWPRFKDPGFVHFHGPPYNRLTTLDRALEGGDLVYMSTGARYWDYVAEVGRTWYCSWEGKPPQAATDLYKEWNEVYERMLEQCRPGKTAANLRRACNGAGINPDRCVAHGIGLDFEPPIVGTYLGEAFEEEWVLKPDMVLVLEPSVWKEGVGGFQAKQTVHITTDGPIVWGNFPMGPLAGEERIIQFPVPPDTLAR